MENFFFQFAFSVGTSYFSSFLWKLTELIAAYQKNKISKKDMSDMIEKAKTQVEENIKNDENIRDEFLEKVKKLMMDNNCIEAITNDDVVAQLSIGEDHIKGTAKLPSDEASEIEKASDIATKEVPAQFKKMNNIFKFEFNSSSCDICPLFASEIRKIEQEETTRRIKREQEEITRRIKREQEEMAHRMKIEQDRIEANSLKKCELLPKPLAELLTSKWKYYSSDLSLCVFEGVHIGDNFLEKAIISMQALHDAHYYIVDNSTTSIMQVKVSECLIDEKFLKFSSSVDGYLIVYGGILFTFKDGGFISI